MPIPELHTAPALSRFAAFFNLITNPLIRFQVDQFILIRLSWFNSSYQLLSIVEAVGQAPSELELGMSSACILISLFLGVGGLVGVEIEGNANSAPTELELEGFGSNEVWAKNIINLPRRNIFQKYF